MLAGIRPYSACLAAFSLDVAFVATSAVASSIIVRPSFDSFGSFDPFDPFGPFGWFEPILVLVTAIITMVILVAELIMAWRSHLEEFEHIASTIVKLDYKLGIR